VKKERSKISLHSGRQIHFIDIDNITGSPSEDFTDHQKVHDLYVKETGYSQGDLCFVACAHASAFAVSKVWNDARVYWRSGYNGADYALIDAFSSANFANVSHIWVASGDGCFISSLKGVKSRTDCTSRCDISLLASDIKKVHREYFNFLTDIRICDVGILSNTFALAA